MKFKGIEIKGSKKFIKQTKEAINLIHKNSKFDFNKITRYLKTIKQSPESGMILEKAQFNVGNPTAFHSVEWYAGTIVHDTHHYYLHHIKKFLWIPKNFKKHERLCNHEQIRFFKKIKASKEWIAWCKDIKEEYWTKEYQSKHPKW
jgi:hypothetical protein